MIRNIILHSTCIFLWCLTSHMIIASETDVQFSSDVRPILANACFHCHGPDDDSREAELRLDQRDGLFEDRGGYSAVVPHKVDESELIRRILSDDPDEQMPPSDSNKTLTAAQREVLVQWVQSGAKWQQHWAFESPVKVQPPNATGEFADWRKNPIDDFVLHKLLDAGLTPSAPATPYELVRRLHLDLIGLPPTPSVADEWVARIWGNDPVGNSGHHGTADDKQYAALVDDLLQRPEYGERWARRWLDLARYADTNGYEKDRPRAIWPYRDWVIQALNADMPFDQFSIEQIAGDLLPNATPSQRIATGFHRNTMLNEEGGIDPLEYRFHAMTDRVATTGTTWLGMTIGCAQCHTHKFDPVSHREYYQLMAFLNNCDEPILELPPDDFQTTWQSHRDQAESLLLELPSLWPVAALEQSDVTITGVTGAANESFRIGDDGFISVSGGDKLAEYVVDFSVGDSRINSLQLQVEALGKQKGPGRTKHGNFVLSEISLQLLEQKEDDVVATTISLKAVDASVAQDGFPLENAVDDDLSTGWAIDGTSGVPRDATATFEFQPPANAAAATGPTQLRVTLDQQYGTSHTIGNFRISFGRSLSESERNQRRENLVRSHFELWLDEQRKTAVDWKPLTPIATDANLALLSIEPDDCIFASGDTAKQDYYEVTFAASDEAITALRLEVLPDERLPARGPGTTYYEGTIGDFFMTEFVVKVGEDATAVRSATESYAANRFGSNPVSAALTIDDDVQTGWSVHNGQGQRHTAVFVLDQPVPAGQQVTVHMTFGRHYASALGKFRVAATSSPRSPVARRMTSESERLLLRSPDDLTADERHQLLNAFLLNSKELATHAKRVRELRKAPETPTTLVMSERIPQNPRSTHRHHRGEYLQPKEAVEPRVPAILHDWPSDLPANRLGFATWLMSKDNPLTARVVVNRHWSALFGIGIVDTLDDFGLQGSPPSHPQLLDWLAAALMHEDNWSIKAVHRRMVTSATYRQSARVSQLSDQVDPLNRLLSHAARFRLEAEVIRDAALMSTGLLSLKKMGPPVRPLQPEGITEVAYGNPSWNVSDGPDRYRRSIYTEIKRTAPFAMITTFDGLSGESCTAKRNRSNSPLQALTLLNDVMFVDIARQSGRRVVDEFNVQGKATSDALVLQTLFRRVLTRFPTTEESKRLLKFVTDTRNRFSADVAARDEFLGDDIPHVQDSAEGTSEAVEIATWATVSRVLLGLDETVTRP
jgi:Protein of unknown function (DUF1553)/Protein of unknown function (DUF1549)/Planctomycete cytochrome C